MPEYPLYCSFCGKRDSEVTDFVAGPSVFICCECVDLCVALFAEAKETRRLAALIPMGEQEYLSWGVG